MQDHVSGRVINASDLLGGVKLEFRAGAPPPRVPGEPHSLGSAEQQRDLPHRTTRSWWRLSLAQWEAQGEAVGGQGGTRRARATRDRASTVRLPTPSLSFSARARARACTEDVEEDEGGGEGSHLTEVAAALRDSFYAGSWAVTDPAGAARAGKGATTGGGGVQAPAAGVAPEIYTVALRAALVEFGEAPSSTLGERLRAADALAPLLGMSKDAHEALLVRAVTTNEGIVHEMQVRGALLACEGKGTAEDTRREAERRCALTVVCVWRAVTGVRAAPAQLWAGSRRLCDARGVRRVEAARAEGGARAAAQPAGHGRVQRAARGEGGRGKWIQGALALCCGLPSCTSGSLEVVPSPLRRRCLYWRPGTWRRPAARGARASCERCWWPHARSLAALGGVACWRADLGPAVLHVCRCCFKPDDVPLCPYAWAHLAVPSGGPAPTAAALGARTQRTQVGGRAGGRAGCCAVASVSGAFV